MENFSNINYNVNQYYSSVYYGMGIICSLLGEVFTDYDYLFYEVMYSCTAALNNLWHALLGSIDKSLSQLFESGFYLSRLA